MTRDPYSVWISEIMLQQTQVATVRGYYESFLAAFPTVADLAAADEQAVLRQWEGLGYYRRARQIHAAARQITGQYAGTFPRDVSEWMALPGIGRYTAGAIVSIAYDQPVPIVEANTTRMFARLIGFRGDPSTTTGQRLLWSIAEALLPRRGAGQFNQALMECGSLVCTPTAPQCDVCPIRSDCMAWADGIVDLIPPQKKRPKIIPVHEVAVLVVRRGRVLLRRCGDEERWSGLWDFPRFACAGMEAMPDDDISSAVLDQTGVSVQIQTVLTTIRHAVTRYRIKLDCYMASYVSGQPHSHRTLPVKWVPCRNLAEYPFSSTGRQLASLIDPLHRHQR